MAVVELEGVIDACKCYSLDAFRKLTGMKAAAIRKARQKGLKVRRVGLRSYILGADWIRFVEEHGIPVE
ncbi:MAG: hypothetical protein HQ582_31715 [Planctomycetes bacterium]|nr:hypothetical protein [Planctomycetota bacterium]